MKNYLRYILFTCIGLSLFPLLARLFSAEEYLSTVTSFLQLYERIVWSISAVFGGTSGFLLFILAMKEHKANSVIRKAAARDDFWNDTQIKNYCRLVFYSIYDSLSGGNRSKVEQFVTPKFYQEFLSMTSEVLVSPEDIVNPIDIIDTRIIASNDRIDNSQDQVSVCLIGHFVYPVEGTNVEAATFHVKKRDFQILCTFSRQGEEWRLSKIDDPLTLFKLLIETRSEFEH